MMNFIEKMNMDILKLNWVNRYSLTIAFFVIWVFFLDSKHSVVKQYKLKNQIAELKDSNNDYQLKLKEAKAEYADLLRNKEKYAREKYFISKEGEDVYIIE